MDIAIVTTKNMTTALAMFDWAMDGPDLQVDSTLMTTVALSLFTRRRAEPQDALPGDPNDRAGWWGDAPIDGSKTQVPIGSRLWLLNRAKSTPTTAALARSYCLEALKWMITDGVASNVACETQWQSPVSLAIGIVIAAPSGAAQNFDFVWQPTALATDPQTVNVGSSPLTDESGNPLTDENGQPLFS